MKLLLLVIVACAGLAIVESGSLRVKPSKKGVESELKALEHVDKVLEKEIDVVNKMESNRNKDDSGEEKDVPAGKDGASGEEHASTGGSNSDEVEEKLEEEELASTGGSNSDEARREE